MYNFIIEMNFKYILLIYVIIDSFKIINLVIFKLIMIFLKNVILYKL